MVRFAVDTGMRAGEINALRWDAVDLANRKVYVPYSVSRVATTNHLNPPKNGEERVIDIGPTLAGALREYPDGLPAHPRFLSSAYVWPSVTAADEPMAWSRDFYLPLWKAAVTATGLSSNLRFHDLRHTCARLLIAANVSVKVIQGRLGHSSYKITTDTCTRRPSTPRPLSWTSCSAASASPARVVHKRGAASNLHQWSRLGFGMSIASGEPWECT
jgi:integrase